jgi:hypothetical protein
VTLTEVTRKIFEALLHQELQHGICNPHDQLCLSSYQGGFRNLRGTIDQVAVLQEIILKHKRNHGKAPILAFLDIKAAYDTVWRPLLWEKCVRNGMSTSMLTILKALSDHNSTRVVINGQKSRKIVHQVGLWQGSIQSPLLYAFFIDDLSVLLAETSRFSIRRTAVAAFLYADDIALIACSQKHLLQILIKCKMVAVRLRIQFAPARCKEVINPGQSVTP